MLAGALLGAPAAGAQTEWLADVTLTRLKPAAGSTRNAISIAAAGLQQIGPVTPILSGGATIAGDSVAAAQIALAVSLLPPWTSRAPIQAGVIVALYGLAAGDRGQSRTLYAEQKLLHERGGYWVSGAVGQIDRISSFSSNALDIGAWFDHGRRHYKATISTTATTDRDVFRGTSMTPNPFAPKVRVADFVLGIVQTGERVTLELVGGARFALEGLEGNRGFAVGTLGWHLRGDASLLFSGGYRLADPLRGTPEWKFVSAGVRITHASRGTSDAAARGRQGPIVAAAQLDDGQVRVVVGAPTTARTVEITGSLTDWEPTPVTRGPDGWTVTVRSDGGSHRILVRVNGGEWRVPANLTPVADEFGKQLGMLIIPR